MRLKMTETDSAFLVAGIINRTTVLNFKNRVEYVLQKSKEMVINIDQVTEIDAFGMDTLCAINKKASTLGKKISIIGLNYSGAEDNLSDYFVS